MNLLIAQLEQFRKTAATGQVTSIPPWRDRYSETRFDAIPRVFQDLLPMVCIPTRRRVVIVAERAFALPLAGLFASDPGLHPWDAIVADSVEHARFIIQMHACHALVVDQSAIGSTTRA